MWRCLPDEGNCGALWENAQVRMGLLSKVRVGAQTMTALNKSKKEVNEAKLQAREAMKALEEKMPE